MAQELSGVTVVIIVSGGALTFILLFVFAKRQIMRFALRNRRGPHVPIGQGAKKALKKEIHRRIDLIPKIVYEPQLINDNDSRYILPPGSQLPPCYYRLKACDDVKVLEREIAKQDPSLKRHPNDNLRAFLLNTLAIPLNGVGQRLVHQFCDYYEHARHDPTEFGDEEYQLFSKVLLKLMDAAKILKNYSGRKVSPRGTPLKHKAQESLREQSVEVKVKERIMEVKDESVESHENTETSV